jgi:hypothetical protein
MPITACRGSRFQLVAVVGGLMLLMSGVAACNGSVATSGLSAQGSGHKRDAGVPAGSCLLQRIQHGAQGAVLLPVSCDRPGAVKVLDSVVFAADADPLAVSGLAGFDGRCSSAHPGAGIDPPSWLGTDGQRLIAVCDMPVNDQQGPPSGVLPEPPALAARTAKDVGNVCGWLPPSMVTRLTGVTLSHCTDLSTDATKLASYTNDPNEAIGLSVVVQMTAARTTFSQAVAQEIAADENVKHVPGLGDDATLMTSPNGHPDVEVLVGRYALAFQEEAALGIQQDGLLKLARGVLGELPSGG